MLPVTVLLLSLVACSSCNAPDNPSAPSAPSAAISEQQAHATINQYRVSKGLAALTWSDIIAAQARQHSQDMASGTAPVGHDGFDKRTVIIGQSIPWSSAGENVAMDSGQRDPVAAAVEGWLKSAEHRANIEGDFNLTGVGSAIGGNGAHYFTQIFIKSR